MSSKNTTVSLTLQFKGSQASQELKRLADQQITDTKKINDQWNRIDTAQKSSVNTAKAGTQAARDTARAGDQLLQTQRATETVLRTQKGHSQQQAQLLKQQQNNAQQLAAQMKKVEQSSLETQRHTQNTFSLWQKGAALATGAVATGAVISTAMQKPRDYDQQLTYIAATATGGQGLSVKERLEARSQLNDYIKGSVRAGGGTREDAASAVNTLIASGKYDLDNVKPALDAAVKTASATGANAIDAATLTTRMQDFGITDLQRGHDIAVRGGQLGSFEYKDLSKWLAQQMAAARTVGYSGEKGYVELVAMNQVAMSTAATSDEAGNNVVNLLAKLSSREFSKSIGDEVRVQKGDPTRLEGKKKPHEVFDWNTYAIQQRDQGVYGVEAFVKLLERQFAGNKQYQTLQNKALNSSNDAERKQALEDMSNIASGSEIGKIIADRQALMAALSVVYKKDELNKLRKELPQAGGTVSADYEMISQTEWAKDQATDQEKLFAQSKAYDSIADSLGGVKDEITDWARKHEDLAAAAYSATIALGALAAGAGIFAVLGGKGGGGIFTKVKDKFSKKPPISTVKMERDPITNLPKDQALKKTTTTVPPISTEKAGSGAKLATVAKTATKVAGATATVATVGVGAYQAYSAYNNPDLTKKQKNTEYAKAAGGTAGTLAGGWAGAKAGGFAGAAIGSAFPVVGTVAGGVVGAAVGGIAGGLAGNWLGDKAGEALSQTINDSSTEQIAVLQQQNDMLTAQNKAITDQTSILSNKLDALMGAMANNRPIINFDGTTFSTSFSQQQNRESKRSAAPPNYLLRK